MGYFSNGTEGLNYQEHFCFRCKNRRDRKDGLGVGCPIWDLHIQYSYDLCNSKSKGKKILDFLIPNEDCSNGECRMFHQTRIRGKK